MRFEFASAGRIVFGPGTIAELPAIAGAWGKRALVVTGKDKIRRAGTAGSKLEKAERLGVSVIDEAGLLRLLGA